MTRKIPWNILIPRLKEALKDFVMPSISQIAAQDNNPFFILISTVISLRTKDEVTMQAAARLFAEAKTPQEFLNLPVSQIEKLIYPAGFYKTKAVNIKRISEILVNQYNGLVPADREKLLALPGVGPKTSSLVLSLGFRINAICVDTHVHRISNRTGWVTTKSPEETEAALMKIMPEKYWIEINEYLVKYGQFLCRPISPWCSKCVIVRWCEKKGVAKSR